MTNNIDNIRQLLEKYYQGASNDAEERILHDFFAAGNIPADMEADRRLFSALDVVAEAPAWLKESVSRNIDRAAATHPRRAKIRWISLSAAASVAIALAIAIPAMRKPAPRQQMTPEEIQEYTIMALTKLTTTVGKGCEGIRMAENKTSETTSKALNSINSI